MSPRRQPAEALGAHQPPLIEKSEEMRTALSAGGFATGSHNTQVREISTLVSSFLGGVDVSQEQERDSKKVLFIPIHRVDWTSAQLLRGGCMLIKVGYRICVRRARRIQVHRRRLLEL
jgi:hypothetical protein